MDQEHVAMLAVDHHLAHVPVVSEHGNLLGVIPPKVLIQVLWQEHAEDLHRFAGMRAGDAQALRAMDAPPLRRVADRLPWLIVGLAGSAVATFVVSRFEDMLAAKVAVGFFVPGIVYLADAIGTQTEAITVRGLPANRVSLWTLLRGELVTGFLVGTILGALALIFAFIAYGDFGLALSVGLALVFAGTIASTVGLFLPWLISRLGRDPAFGSGPLATVLQDVLSLIIYFVIVQMVLS
jgi:magnesium transporter